MSTSNRDRKWHSGPTRWPQRKPVEKPGFKNGARVKEKAQ